MADPLIPRLIREHGPKLIGKALNKPTLDNATGKPDKQPLHRKIANGIMMRVATKSVPGAIIVGGYLVARHLNDRRKAKALKDKG